MKVALVQSPFIPMNLQVCGGVERTVLAELDGLERAGCEVTLYVSQLRGGSDPRIKVIKTENPSHRVLMWPFYLRVLCAARDADVIHAHYAPPLALLAPRRTLVHLHGLAIGWLPYYGRVPRRYWGSHYVCCSHHTRAAFLERYPTLSGQRVHVLHNGACPELFRPPESRAGSGCLRVGFHGLWHPRKGIFDLLAAARLLLDRRCEFRLLLAGSAFFQGGDPDACQAIDAQVRAIAAELGNVDLVGELTHPQLAARLQTVDIGVFPSNHEEPFGNAALEMMSCGMPVVGYEAGGLRESCPDGVTGFRVPWGDVQALADKLELLLEDEVLRRRLGEQARQHVLDNFTWDLHVTRLLGLYEEIVRSAGRR